jgi:hypothetical protein
MAIDSWQIPQEALERIIKGVCDVDPRLAAAANKIDRRSFAIDMSSCSYCFDLSTKLGNRATAKERRKSLDQIKRASERTHRLLTLALSDDWLSKELSLGLSLADGWDGSTLISHIEASVEPGKILLDELLARLSALARVKPVYPVFLDKMDMSAFEFFAGRYLPDLFRKHFGSAPARKRDPYGNGTIEGGVIAFASAVMRELHITKRDGSAYADEAISRAMTRARQKKGRRCGK